MIQMQPNRAAAARQQQKQKREQMCSAMHYMLAGQ
jgi:hypothetical protein